MCCLPCEERRFIIDATLGNVYLLKISQILNYSYYLNVSYMFNMQGQVSHLLEEYHYNILYKCKKAFILKKSYFY